jgi:hypothetical protein
MNIRPDIMRTPDYVVAPDLGETTKEFRRMNKQWSGDFLE